MEKNPSLQILVPFIVCRIENNYDSVEDNGFAKKNLYLMVINALNNNKWVNLEFHVRWDYSETSIDKDSCLLFDCRHESWWYLGWQGWAHSERKCSQAPSQNSCEVVVVLASNDDLKYSNLKPHLFELLCKQLLIQVDKFEADNFIIIHAILKVGMRK